MALWDVGVLLSQTLPLQTNARLIMELVEPLDVKVGDHVSGPSAIGMLIEAATADDARPLALGLVRDVLHLLGVDDDGLAVYFLRRRMDAEVAD